MSFADFLYRALPETPDSVNRFDRTWRMRFPVRWCRLYVADRSNRLRDERDEMDRYSFMYFGQKWRVSIDTGRSIWREIYTGPTHEAAAYDPTAYELPRRRYLRRGDKIVFAKEWFVWGLGRFHGHFRFKPHVWVLDYYGGKLAFNIRRDHDGRNLT